MLAWTVREGITNVIRHSHARHCSIRVRREQARATVEVIDDGDAEGANAHAPNTPGSGLSGLAERVTARGGRLEAGALESAGKRGFRLWVSLPLRESAGPAAEQS